MEKGGQTIRSMMMMFLSGLIGLLHYLFCAAFATFFSFTLWAQSGSLDPTFGINGINTFLPQPVFNKAYSTLIQDERHLKLLNK